MSSSLQYIFAASPSTTRGKPILVGGDPKGNNLLYTTGSSVFMRNLQDPLKAEMYTEHSHATTVARYSPSGFYIASADITGSVRIWDTTQKEHILKIELKPLSGSILDLQWSDDSKRIVAVGEGREKFGAVFLFDSGSSVGEISGLTKPITTCDFKQVRPYRIATGSEDFQVGWFEGPPFKFKKTMTEHTRFVNCVRFSPDGNKLVTVSSDKTGQIYDGKTGDLIGPLSTNNGHTAGIYACSWSPDSKQILTASADKTAKIWDAESRNCLTTFTFEDTLENQMLGCLWQGDTLITIALSGDIFYLDRNSPSRPLRIVKGHNKFITALAFDSDNGQLYSASYDGNIIRWDVKSGATEGFNGKGHTNQINGAYIQGNTLVTAAMDDTVRITPLGTRTYNNDSIKLESTPANIAVGKKDQKLVVAATTDSIVIIKDGKVASKFPVKYQPTTVVLSTNELQVAVGGKDNNIYLYSLSGTTLSEKSVLKSHRNPITALAYSPNGAVLASGDSNREILVWDLGTNSVKVQGWVFHTSRVTALAWAPDSIHLVSVAGDGNLYVWDLEKTDKRIFVKDAHRGGATAAVWIDGNTVASAGQDCCVKTWTFSFH